MEASSMRLWIQAGYSRLREPSTAMIWTSITKMDTEWYDADTTAVTAHSSATRVAHSGKSCTARARERTGSEEGRHQPQV